MTTARRVSLALIGGCLVACAAQAGEGGKGKGCPAQFSDFDLNGDGAIVEQEWSEGHAKRFEKMAEEGRKMKHAGEMPTFSEIDLDGDGQVNEEEFAAHKEAHQHQHRHQHGGKQEAQSET